MKLGEKRAFLQKAATFAKSGFFLSLECTVNQYFSVFFNLGVF